MFKKRYCFYWYFGLFWFIQMKIFIFTCISGYLDILDGGRRLWVVIVGAASPQQPNNPPKQNNQLKWMDFENLDRKKQMDE